MKKTVVVSAVNIVDGGPLTILKEFLISLRENTGPSVKIVAIVHTAIRGHLKNIDYIELKWPKKSWLARLFCEYLYFFWLSRKLKADIWISLADTTPNVSANIRAVYCHNPGPFFSTSIRETLHEPKFFLISKFYRYIYKLNIQKNSFVIVQQEWMREKFEKMFGVNNVVVCTPEVSIQSSGSFPSNSLGRCVFVYPSFPRFFKNFEVLCEAVRMLNQVGIDGFELQITLSGNENRYAKEIFERYSSEPNIRFVGRLRPEQMQTFYEQADVLLFPSRLETWGLPITEMKAFGKPILAADLPYAHETVGNYDLISYFDPANAASLACLMKNVINGDVQYQGSSYEKKYSPKLDGWKTLIELITGKLPKD